MKLKLLKIIKFCIIYTIIGLVWQILELIVYGEIHPRLIDGIIAALLSLMAITPINSFKKLHYKIMLRRSVNQYNYYTTITGMPNEYYAGEIKRYKKLIEELQ